MKFQNKILFLIFLIFFISFQSNCQISNNKIIENNNIDTYSTLIDFYGKPSIILFGSTYCSHCKEALPIFKEKVYNVYNKEINIWINVINNDYFDITDIPQGFNEEIDFEKITNIECKYVPSWIILDKFGNVKMSSCGNEKTMNEMVYTINELIKK
ncbi:hypothetical protein HOD20_01295 [archaeon]|jgi:thiol-disulfide isomerase/thioredoxin|nr:hypothetical protein [archaeon]MBT4351139.1 hypothetical protein [archaeon]MBT4647365.1 hypothetical protein [archaeon]MBT6821199.1 hypothetical protein [archaeon]MBT7391251.1 hypothetical protein [archaeon]